MSREEIPDGAPGGVFRRLSAMVYDGLLLLAVLIAGSFLFLPLTGGEAVDGPMRLAFQAYVVLLIVGFFGYFWMRGGQTLGLWTWKLRLQRHDGGRIGMNDVMLRIMVGVLTLGPIALISVPFHPRRLSLTDMLSTTLVVRHRTRDVV
ncbi:putative RDD family membrane protein YckC [Natronocella acetinitrilica]|uniref:RDD family membrane protein YckC n=1 Tax=Natronocella acetinitrilica TaxID=414046 RepID=A0AAE3G389_9GAMM|nr:RDD family protein [Natronocella acetinitrilica]MCP1675000.1 putative RDD family membrane protein YckC [Natronocella acetinitrilica]